MDSTKAISLYEQFAAAMACVEVCQDNGDIGIGTAFHVGEGVFVTARHVVDCATITRITTTVPCEVRLAPEEASPSSSMVHRGDKSFPVYKVRPQSLEIECGPFYSNRTDEDIAVFKVRRYDSRLPVVPLGGHLDDWLGQDTFVLSSAIILGYPPIPLTTEPVLFAARAEVNALVDLRSSGHPHFVLSAMARGGLSGGVAISEHGFALGVVTRSLLRNSLEAELGYLSVLTVEPILQCLAEHRLLPDVQAEDWNGLFTRDEIEVGTTVDFGGSVTGFSPQASVGILDDGKRLILDIRHYQSVSTAPRAFDAAFAHLSSLDTSPNVSERRCYEIHFNGVVNDEVRRLFAEAREISLRELMRDTDMVRRSLS